MASEEIKTPNRTRNNRVWTGFILLIVGIFILAQRMGASLPNWLFNWQVVLIAIGVFIGMRRRFHGPGWLIMILIGSFFWVEEFYPQGAIHQYLWPILLIGVGLVFIFRSRGYENKNNLYSSDYWKDKKRQWEQQYNESIPLDEDYIDVTNILSGTKKNILSKNFKGGDVTSFMGGTEIDLSQADINGRVVMDLTQIFGGTKLIVPPHWDVRAELVSLFAGVEDRRQPDARAIDAGKVLILKGTSIFGGIDIRSY